jgi:endoribonuclease LACTB2
MSEEIVQPKDAAAVIMLRNPDDPEVYWVKRSLSLKFMGGFHAFPGGQRDANDSEIPVENCDDPVEAAMMVCGVREIFEETGILIARGVENLSQKNLTDLREELESGRVKFSEVFLREKLSIDANLLVVAPRWVTPPPAPKRFDTRFFVAWVPHCKDGLQIASVIPGELESGEWNRPIEAINKWRDGEVILPSPVLSPLVEMEKGIEGFVERLHQFSHEGFERKCVEFRYGYKMVPLRTPTLPPATHTNCFVVGGDEVVIIDPGSPYPEEQQKLDDLLIKLQETGVSLREIIITHLHPDHILGVNHLAEKFNIPVAAHRLTAEEINSEIKVDRYIEDNDIIHLRGVRDVKLQALWTPGHARGHLSFYEERTGTLITGDCVVGIGTVVIAPPEGNMSDYLSSLQRYLELPKLNALLPAHGPVVADARGKIEEYILHRGTREKMILELLATEPRTIPNIVKIVYKGVPESLHKLAALSVQAHLDKLMLEEKVQQNGEEFLVSVQYEER